MQLQAADPDSDELNAGHIKHAADDALSALNVPAKQGETLLPLPVYPASAKHPLSVTMPVALPVPVLSGHEEHAAAPVAALNVSAAHAITLAPWPVKPATPTQSSSSSDAPGLLLLAGHNRQLELPVVRLNWFVWQGAHDVRWLRPDILL